MFEKTNFVKSILDIIFSIKKTTVTKLESIDAGPYRTSNDLCCVSTGTDRSYNGTDAG